MTAPGGEPNRPTTSEEQEAESGGAERSSNAPKSKKKPRKEEIVAEATRLFAERGYDGTSMGDLAERVGLRKASLFHHFETKDVLYSAVLSQLLEDVQGAIVRAGAAEGSFPDRLDALTDAITSMLGKQPHAARLLIREAMDWGPVMRESLAATIKDVLGVAVGFARAGQQAGAFNASLDPEQLIITLIGIYFMPFLLDRTLEGFVNKAIFEASFLEDRRLAVRAQIRLMVLSPQAQAAAADA